MKGEGIISVEDLEEFEDDDIDNVIQNFRQPQDIWHPTVQAHARSAEVLENLAAIPPVAYQATVLQRDRVDAWNKKQASLVCASLSVK